MGGVTRMVIIQREGMITEIRRESPVFPPDRKARRFFIPGALIILGLFGNVWITGVFMTAGYEMGTAQASHRELLRERDELKTEIATLRDPDRIRTIAQNQLGLEAAGTDRMTRIP